MTSCPGGVCLSWCPPPTDCGVFPKDTRAFPCRIRGGLKRFRRRQPAAHQEPLVQIQSAAPHQADFDQKYRQACNWNDHELALVDLLRWQASANLPPWKEAPGMRIMTVAFALVTALVLCNPGTFAAAHARQ